MYTMKKRVITIMLLSVFLCSFPIGCSRINNQETATLSKAESDSIANAQTAYELTSLLTRTSDLPKYSECNQDNDLYAYFDLLGANDYFIVSHEDEKYILFCYVYSGYGEELSSITDIEKVYDSENSGRLNLTAAKDIKTTEQTGCFPEITSVRCIVKLEEDITSLYVDGELYSEYDGGYIQVNDKYGVVDSDLNIIVPIQYDTIRDFETFATDKQYYFTATEQGAGLMDENYKTILNPKYDNIFFVNDNKFIVGKGPRDEVSLGNSQIGILNKNEELIHNYIDGFIDGNESFNNDVHQVVFGRMNGDVYLEGVLDDDLNVIIEPQYTSISVFEIESQKDQFYVVENDKGEFAVIDSSGKQQTEFKAASVYDVQTNYYNSLELADLT